MKGKKLIVIMAIVILIFTIQASCALDEDNDFNLTKTNDIDTVNVQIDKVNNDISDNILVNDSQASASSAKEILGATNNDVLGVDRHFTGTTYSELRSYLQNSVFNGDNVFLDGKTFSGSQTNTLIIIFLYTC